MKKTEIRLSDHFTYGRLFRFVLPSVIMMVFTSIYGVVDGIFISNFAGSVPFAGVNLILPFVMIFSTVGFMFGTGGSALVAKVMGEGQAEKARRIFSLLIYVLIGVGLLFTILGEIFLPAVARAFGAEGDLLDYAIRYGRISFLSLTPFMLQNTFQSFLNTAERPKLGLLITVGAGLANIILDAVFVGALGLSVEGAAAATAVSECLGGFLPLIFFLSRNKSPLRLTRPEKDLRCLLLTCTNGASEFMTNVSMSFVNMLYNIRLLELAGENGVAAYGVIMYISFIFVAIYIGYAMGSAPIVSYHYGAGNRDELKNMFRMSHRIILVISLAMLALSEVTASFIAGIYVGYDGALYDLTVRAIQIYSTSYLFAGYNIFGSAFFTALNNGKISALISFVRVLLFQLVCILVLPIFWGADGIWASLPVSEILSVLVTYICLRRCRGIYSYA